MQIFHASLYCNHLPFPLLKRRKFDFCIYICASVGLKLIGHTCLFKVYFLMKLLSMFMPNYHRFLFSCTLDNNNNITKKSTPNSAATKKNYPLIIG